MSKHQLSEAPLPQAKRLHISSFTETHVPSEARSPGSFDSLLYDEIILVIFSYLSWIDLCAIQSTNRNWSRLSLDNQLWKALYLNEYGRSRLRGIRGFIGRADGREIRPLPGRAKSEDVRDWKWMFRISSNWRTGRCSVEQLGADIIHPSIAASSAAPTTTESTISHTHVLLAGDLTIIASSRSTAAPSISLTSSNHETHILHCSPARVWGTTEITSLALDQSPPTNGHHLRLISFLSTGEFSVFSINHHTPCGSSRVLTYIPTSRTPRTSPIIHAVYHHPLLATLSQSFHLSLYDLSSNAVSHTQTLSSFTSYPPSSLVLSTPTPSTYKLVVAYAIPVYPAHWSVGATELIISSSPSMAASTTRTTRAFDIPLGWIDEQKFKSVHEQWGRKVARVADTQTDGKWVVLAPGDVPSPSTPPSPHSSSSLSSSTSYTSSSLHSPTSLQLYRLYLPSSTSSSSLPKLTFVRTLHGQTGPISALSLADGRCVSLGVNGSIWVWDLEGCTGAEVTQGPLEDDVSKSDSESQRMNSLQKGTVVFDERRIISTTPRGIEVRRFDV